MTNLSLMAIVFLIMFLAVDQTMINNLALLSIAILSFFNARKIVETKEKVAVVGETTDAIHTLSNSNMAAQLRINVQLAQVAAVLSHRLADMSRQPADIASAVAADLTVKEHEVLLQTHLVQQAKIDAGKTRESEGKK